MIVNFKNQGAEDIFNGIASKLAQKSCPAILWKIARRKLELLDSVIAFDELKGPPGNKLEP